MKISVVTRGGGDGTGMEQVIIPAFSKQFENIKVEHASLGGEPDYWAKVVTGHLGKDLADVVWASNGGFSALGFAGRLQGAGAAGAGRQATTSRTTSRRAWTRSSIEGKLYGLPWGGHPGYQGLLYNEDLLHPRRAEAPGRHLDLGQADRGGQGGHPRQRRPQHRRLRLHPLTPRTTWG